MSFRLLLSPSFLFRDKGTYKEQQIVIQSSGGLNKDEIENMMRPTPRLIRSTVGRALWVCE